MIHCYHCFTTTVDEDFICDTCEELYCEECSYTFSLHYQFQGSRCYSCADQSRRNRLTKEEIRDNKLKLIQMKKYKLECYGWEMEALCHSLDNDKVERINKLVEEGQELYEVVHDIEDCDVDIYSPDLFHITRGLDNDTMKFYLKDEDGNEILTFGIEQVRVVWDSFDYEGGYTSLSAFPEDDNKLFIAFENKGGICSYEFESDEIPKMEDFSYLNGDIETPEGCWDFIDKIFFKGEELEITDCLDNMGKATSVYLWS